VTEIAILKSLLKEPAKSLLDPEISKAVVLSKTTFKDHVIREACMSLLLNDGNWDAAKNDEAHHEAR